MLKQNPESNIEIKNEIIIESTTMKDTKVEN